MNKRIEDSNFRILYETGKLVLGHVFESAYLIFKENDVDIHLGDFYGDPSCGIIDKDNKWCLVAGAILTIWGNNGVSSSIKEDDFYWTCKVRQIGSYDVELLIDPWTDKGSIWKLNIQTSERHKVKDFLIEGDYNEDFDW